MFRWLLLGMTVVVVLVMVMLSSSAMAVLRRNLPMLSRPMSWLESAWPGGPDLDHVALFALLAFLWRLLMLRLRWWTVALALVAFALLTEAIQFMADGRTPLWTDVRDNLIGLVLGLVLAMPLALLIGGRKKVAKDSL